MTGLHNLPLEILTMIIVAAVDDALEHLLVVDRGGMSDIAIAIEQLAQVSRIFNETIRARLLQRQRVAEEQCADLSRWRCEDVHVKCRKRCRLCRARYERLDRARVMAGRLARMLVVVDIERAKMA